MRGGCGGASLVSSPAAPVAPPDLFCILNFVEWGCGVACSAPSVKAHWMSSSSAHSLERSCTCRVSMSSPTSLHHLGGGQASLPAIFLRVRPSARARVLCRGAEVRPGELLQAVRVDVHVVSWLHMLLQYILAAGGAHEVRGRVRRRAAGLGSSR